MICLANEIDTNALKKIWQISFGDSAAYIDYFFSKLMQPENTLVYCESNHTPAAMLFLLPAELVLQGQSLPVQYIYAACTLPECRGRGYMKQLIDAASALGKSRGIYQTILVPAEESLFAYYEKNGYRNYFKRKSFGLSRSELEKYNGKGCQKLPVSVPGIIKQRNSSFSAVGTVKWPDAHIKYAIEEAFICGGGVLYTDFGYAFYKPYNNTLTVYETSIAPQHFNAFCGLLLNEFPNSQAFAFHVPAEWQTPEGVSAKSYWYGMLRSESTKDYNPSEQGAYLSLALD